SSPQEAGEAAFAGDRRVVDPVEGIPRMLVAHERAEPGELVVRPSSEDGEGDPTGVEVRRVADPPDGQGAALALLLDGPTRMEHVLEDDEQVPSFEDVDQRGRTV